MLRYNLSRLFLLKGISKPAVFLTNAGFSKSVAYRLAEEKINSLHSKHIERLCMAFKCTPNDLMEWTPDKPEQMKNDQPLAKLMSGTSAVLDLRSLCSDIPFEKLPLFAEKINAMKNDLVAGK